MKLYRTCQMLLAFALAAVCYIPQTGCSKDYSFEGADTLTRSDTIVRGDTISQPSTNKFLFCNLCKENEPLSVGGWSFKTGGAFVCGTTTNAGFIGANSTFTLFGPSACSIDTGLVMTVYLNFDMIENTFNATTDRAAFYYYDHFGTHDIFISRSAAPFFVKISSYYPTTRIAIGTFGGIVFRPNGDTAVITDGKFKVLLK